MKTTWTVTVDENGVLTFPPDLMEQVGWKIGDTLLWTDNSDGTWNLTKKVLQYNMDDKVQEAMDILQEECAEVIQIISKCRRFGIDETHIKSGKSNRANLEEELGDMLALVQILVELGVVTEQNLEQAKQEKFEKLKKWSKLYEQD